MKIMVVHQFYLGKGDAGGSRWNQFSKYWASKGHQVTVIAGNVHYSSGQRYPGCDGHYIVEERPLPNVRLLRCHVSKSYGSGSRIGRLMAMLSFLLSSIVAGITKANRPDVIIATSPPLAVSLTMWFLSAIYRAPAVFEVRDLWPDCLVEEGLVKNRKLLWPFYRMEHIGYFKSKWVNVLTPAFETWLIEKKNVPPSRISMIPNAADLDVMKPGPRDNVVRQKLGLQGKFVVSYFGAHGRANALHQLLNVAAMVRDEMPDVRIMLVGDGPEKPALMERAKQENLANVLFVNSISKSEVENYINASDVCTATLMNIAHYAMYYPNKVFDYMCCNRPIIIAIDGVARQLVEKAGVGLFAQPEHPQSFCNALKQLHDNPEQTRLMGEKGLPFVTANFSRQMLADRYLTILEQLVADNKKS